LTTPNDVLEITAVGKPNDGVLVAFCASNRTSRLRCSSNLIRLPTVMSTWKYDGPVKKFLPVFPNSPADGAKNLAVCSGVKKAFLPLALRKMLPMSGVHPLQLAGV